MPKRKSAPSKPPIDFLPGKHLLDPDSGRPEKGSRQVKVYIPNGIFERLEDYAAEEGVAPSRLAAEIISSHVRTQDAAWANALAARALMREADEYAAFMKGVETGKGAS